MFEDLFRPCSMFEYVFTPSLNICLHSVWKHVYTISRDMIISISFALAHHLQRHIACKIKNGRQGLERSLNLRFWALTASFAKKSLLIQEADRSRNNCLNTVFIPSLKVCLYQDRRLYNIWTQLLNQWLHHISILQNNSNYLEKFKKALILLKKKSKLVQKDLKWIKSNQYGLRCFIMVWNS